MTDKKSTSPIMTPEWFASLLENDVVPVPTDTEGNPLPEASKQSTACDWRQNPMLSALHNLITSLNKGNFEDARQETQTINRCLATGVVCNSEELDDCLFDLGK